MNDLCDIKEETPGFSIPDPKAESEDESGADPLFSEAVMLFLEKQIVITFLLQRKLCIVYSRAAKLIDEMERLKTVGICNESKERKL